MAEESFMLDCPMNDADIVIMNRNYEKYLSKFRYQPRRTQQPPDAADHQLVSTFEKLSVAPTKPPDAADHQLVSTFEKLSVAPTNSN